MGALNTIPPNPFPPSTEQQGESGAPYELPIAGAETLGGVKVGTGLSIDAETGVLSNPNPTPYSLPIAGAETLGGVMVGAGLSVDAETGELTNTNPTPFTPAPYSTAEQATGETWLNGESIYKRVYALQNEVTVANNNWTTVTDIVLSNNEKVIKAYGYNTAGAAYPFNTTGDAENHLLLRACVDNATASVDVIIIEYFKPAPTP